MLSKSLHLAVELTLFLLVVADGICGYFLLDPSPGVKALAFLLHVAVVLLFIYLIKDFKNDEVAAGGNFTAIAMALSLAIPLYALLGSYLAWHGLRRVEPPDGSYFALDDEFTPKKTHRDFRDVDEMMIALVRDELDIEAFGDLFRRNNPQLEENAINKLARITTRESVTILRNAVRTSTSDTRVLAANALIGMEGRIVKRIESLESSLERDPNNRTLILQLARQYDLYCHLGVLESNMQTHYQNLAIEQYSTYLRLDHADAGVLHELGRLHLKANNNAEAIRTLSKAVDMGHAKPETRMWLAEAYFHNSDFTSVREICSELKRWSDLPSRMSPVVNWWVGDDEEELDVIVPVDEDPDVAAHDQK